MFDIKTEKDLKLFLKIVAEEAVKETKTLLENKGINPDPYVSSFQKRLESDGLLEAEEDAEEDAEELKNKDKESTSDSPTDSKDNNDDTDEEEAKEEEEENQDTDSDANPAKEKALSLGGYDEDTGA